MLAESYRARPILFVGPANKDFPLPNLLVVIPALNEAESVGHVVAEVISELRADVVVIDDGSVDETAMIARAAGATVLQHPFNLGVGSAVRTGLRYAYEQGYARVVQIDADGQHVPAQAVHLLDRLEGSDLVVGSRFAAGYQRDSAGYRVSVPRRGAMRLLARLVSRRLASDITDATSGFRAFGPRAIEVFSHSYPSAYLSDTVEALLLAADRGLVVIEVAAEMNERAAGAPSTGRLRSLYHLVRVVLVVLLHRVRYPVNQRGTL